MKFLIARQIDLQIWFNILQDRSLEISFFSSIKLHLANEEIYPYFSMIICVKTKPTSSVPIGTPANNISRANKNYVTRTSISYDYPNFTLPSNR